MSNTEIQDSLRSARHTLKDEVLYWRNLLENDIYDKDGKVLDVYRDVGIKEEYKGTDEYYGVLDYILDSKLEIEYTCSSNKSYLGAELLMSQWPVIYIDTRGGVKHYGKIHGVHLGCEEIEFGYEDKIGLNDYLAKLYESKE